MLVTRFLPRARPSSPVAGTPRRLGTQCARPGGLGTRSGRHRGEGAQAHQVVDGGGEGEHPAHARSSSVTGLPHQPHGLQPAEDLLHPFPAGLAHRVAGVPGGAAIQGRVRPLRQMRRHGRRAQGLNTPPRIVPLYRPRASRAHAAGAAGPSARAGGPPRPARRCRWPA